MRADAQRNRAKVLEAAIELFAARGLAVSVHEIADHAGVGTGTVSRHFPTKEALFDAIVRARVEQLVRQARRLAAEREPGDAFFEFLALMVEEGGTDRGLADALAGAGFDVERAATDPDHDLDAAIREILSRAQASGAVRGDVDATDVRSVIEGCIARERHGQDAAARRRMVTIASQGLRS
ncbi:TetR/AcrR family transcriptional regulator [Phytoactinopolyspora halotolerans]|uniref:TetR/AcrR family transcriptional regulator n=1 Tax=Phytoactinopolyspora halotolerans TaxID=1981512 RepID=A0A6L9SER3_9ACTN|nr:TetR/AcrR family transcriptional regulator [Phytoactinopolyspora halotolerans]NEE03603.1 TetR/AcrR family transcriptional regulator [Phytoactinopolyspora halotolerans]